MINFKISLHAPALFLSLLILCCAPPVTPPEDDLAPEVLHIISGNVAIGVAAQYSEVCTYHATAICTRANRNGDYNLHDVSGTQGWLEADYVNSVGESTILRSAYFIDSEVIDGLVNINPTTDIISQIWLAQFQMTDIETCIIDDCLTSTNNLITPVLFDTIEANLASILRPFWPENLGSIRTSDYIADPSANELDLMHELINYELDFENGNLEVWDNNNLRIAQVPFADLTELEFDPTTGVYDVVLESEMEAALPFRAQPPSGIPPINISLSIEPSLFGVAPFTYTIETSANSSILLDPTYSFEHIIIAPDSSMTSWSENTHTGTLINGGSHDVIVHVTADTGEQAIRGAIIELDRDENTPATYGGSGSCRPEILEVNDLNICIELLDGGDLNSCNENDTFLEVNNRCSRSTQLDGSYIGHCELLDNQLNRVHYQNPLKFSNESIEDQQARLLAVCEADFGLWFN